MASLLEDLAFRGLVHQETSPGALADHLAAPRKVYAGFDPTSSSLTIGNLVQMLLLARFQRAGHTPVVVMGGGTGLVGDPSGKSAERPMLSLDEIRANVEGQRKLFERVLDFSGSHAARITNNADWLGKLGFLEALRDIGKHFSVNAMLQRDTVRDRLTQREQGISYTEFSYMLLQAYDFLHLYEEHGVTVQAAGSDQWGNIVAGIDLIRRTRRAEVYGLTTPLVTRADGGKFGKTESGAVWLTKERTSPYAFYQFWLNTADADVFRFLKIYTFLEPARLAELEQEQTANPGARAAQRTLAETLTELLHGSAGVEQARAATQALFSGEVAALSREDLEEVFQNAPASSIARVELTGDGLPLPDFLVTAQIAKSKREARELLTTNAISVNSRKCGVDDRITTEWLLHGDTALVRRGKKTWHVVRAIEGDNAPEGSDVIG